MSAQPQTSRAPRPSLIVGLDCGLQTGYAEYSTVEGCLLDVLTTDFWSAYERISLFCSKAHTLVVIEWPSANKPTFREGNSAGIQDRMSQAVGRVKRETELMAEGLERLGYTVERVRPVDGKKKAKEFKQLTGWQGRTNSHERDAAMLVVGRSNWPVSVRVK